MTAALVIVVAGLGLACYRLWEIWWNESYCGRCGRLHRECRCQPERLL